MSDLTYYQARALATAPLLPRIETTFWVVKAPTRGSRGKQWTYLSVGDWGAFGWTNEIKYAKLFTEPPSDIPALAQKAYNRSVVYAKQAVAVAVRRVYEYTLEERGA